MGQCMSYGEIGACSDNLRSRRHKRSSGWSRLSLRHSRSAQASDLQSLTSPPSPTHDTLPSPRHPHQQPRLSSHLHHVNKRPSIDSLTAHEIASVLKTGKVTILSPDAGADPANIATFLEDDTMLAEYSVDQIIAEGAYWVLAKVTRTRDRKEASPCCLFRLLIKKVSKAKIPQSNIYIQPCENNKTCQCNKCAPFHTDRPPIELVLLNSRDSGLPQLVDSIEDADHYYIVTKMHGPSQKQWRHLSSWFGRGRYSTVYWREYLT
ncbi:hypothetical protein BC831DRAFT_397276 [Entophlyctis helioformis]|nr:hypothetical protein BC831DRAFT_397276 [Entophlyctis helioformis]